MRQNNLALKADETLGEFSETYGISSIRRLARKLEEGRKIEDYLKEEINDTASGITHLPEVGIRREESFELPLPSSSNYSIILKKWNGYIENINGQEFTAVLTDPLGKSPDIRASFSIDEVSEGDRDLVTENALFDWVVSRDRKSHGQVENKDFLIFKRLPMWKKSDLDSRSTKVEAFDAWLNSSSTT